MTATAPTVETAVSPAAGETAGDRPLARWAWWLYPLAVTLLTGAYLIAHYSGPAWLNSGPVYNLIGASTVAALLLGSRGTPPERRLPWLLFALGQGMFVVGDVLAFNYRRLFASALPSPSIADPFHLALYPLLIAGLLLLLRERNRTRDRAALIDAAITTVALASLAWVYLMAPYADDPNLSLTTKLVSIAYPTMDILILAVIARAAASSLRREPALTLLFFGTVALLLTDALHGWRLLHGGYRTGGLLDGGWAVFYALLGAAALHRSLRKEPEQAPEADGRLTRARLALLTCASLTALLIIVVREAAGDSLDIDVLIAASGIMFALVIARMAGIVRRNEEVTSREAKLRAELFRAELEHRSFHDELTGLPNRALFRNRVEHALAGRRRERLPVAVLFLDVDDFKNVNDSLGHAAGDEVLQELARRLQDCMRPVDTIARLGGDEFAILVHDAESELHSIEIAERARSALEVPISLEGREITIAASIGIAFNDQDMISAQDADELLRNADAAMYMAKESANKGDYRVFQPEMHVQALARLELKTDLQRALDAGEFTLRYQPIMDLLRGDVGGMEALIRWEHPERGTVSPGDFVPLLEDTGLIVPVGHHILIEACRWAAHMQRECPRNPPLSIAVNVSAFQLQRPEFIAEVREALADSEIPPSSLTLELTESVMMRDMELSLMRLKALRALGVRLAIDDFGTGYSSLNYVRRLPVDVLKIDRSFLADPNPEVAELTAAIVALARIFKLKAVAEGIENTDQLQRVQAMRCDYAQGFYFAKPLTGEEVLAMVSAQPSLVRWPAEWARA